MNQSLQESLSTLLDGEASELELRRLLTQVEDPALRQQWQALNQQQRALHAQPQAFLQWDISQAVREAVAEEAQAGATVVVADTLAARTTRMPRWLQPAAGFAIAASVAAVVVLFGQPGASLDGALPSAAPLASRATVPQAVQPVAGRVALASYGNMTPVGEALPAMDAAAQQRLEQYMFDHAQVVAAGGVHGIVPLARVIRFEE